MKVSDILRVKGGGTLYTVPPQEPLRTAIKTMADFDIGSLLVMEHGRLVGMLSFREVISAVAANGGSVGELPVQAVMNRTPPTCAPGTDIDEVRRLMLGEHARYLPVLDSDMLMGVISFYDVAKAVVEGQDFENRMLRAYISDSPVEADVGGGRSG